MISSLALLVLGAAAAATPCENLKTLPLPNTTITSSELVKTGSPFPAPPAAPRGGGGAGAPAGARGRGGAPATTPVDFCRVVAVLTPSSDSHINVEIWLPSADKWNGKFQAEGNGGWAGSIQGLPAMQTAIRAGYATAGSDTGHSVGNGSFAIGHPEQV